MKKKSQNSIFVSLLLLLFFIGCRQDILLQNEEKFDASSAKFKIVKLKDIPQVAKFIRQKTGRNDNLMPLKMGNEFAKGEIDYANLETSLIVQNTEGNDTFYTFQITNAGDDKTFYNLEVKEVEGTLADARVIEYASSIAFGNNPIAVLDNFTGTVKAFGVDGNLKSGISFTYGEGPCDDTPTTPGTGTGNPVAGGSDGGPIFGNPINPPGANTPPDLGPSLPYGPSYPSGGDGSGDGDENLIPSEGCANPNSYVQIGTVSGIPVYQNDCGWVRFGTTSYAAKSISKLKPGCDDDGSGVILLPGGSPQVDTPCERIKKVGKNDVTKNAMKNLKKPEILNDNKEHAYLLWENSLGELQDDIYGTGPENSAGIRIQFNAGDKFSAYLHSHYQGAEMLSIFSFDDFLTLCQLIHFDAIKDVSSFVLGVTSPKGTGGTQYMMIIDDPAKLATFASQFFTNGKIDEKKSDLIENFYNGIVRFDKSIEGNENGLVNFLELQDIGLKLMKGDNQMENWQLLTKDENNNFATVNCN